MIFDQYVHTDIGANGLAKYLENHGIRKIPRQNGKNPLFDVVKLLMADAERKRFMVQEMTISLWSRMIIYWWMDCMRELSQRNFGMKRR